MVNRKGFLLTVIFLTTWMVPVSADETADDIVNMMGWWQEYGRYWDEIGADTAGLDDELSFAGLEEFLYEATAEKEEVVQDKTIKADPEINVIMAKRSEP